MWHKSTSKSQAGNRQLLSSSHFDNLSNRGANRKMICLDCLQIHSQFLQTRKVFVPIRILSSMRVWPYLMFPFFILNCPQPSSIFLKYLTEKEHSVKHLNEQMNKLHWHGPDGESGGNHRLLPGANVSPPGTVYGPICTCGHSWQSQYWQTWQHHHRGCVSAHPAGPYGVEMKHTQQPSRSGPSKVEVSGNSMCVVSGKPSVSLLLALAPHPAQPRAQPPRPAPAWRPAAPPRSPGCGRPTRTHLGSGRAWSSKHINASCQGCRAHARVTTRVSRGEQTSQQWRPPPAEELGEELHEPHARPGRQEEQCCCRPQTLRLRD